MTTTIRAAVLEGVDAPLVLTDVEIADPRPGEVLVRVSHCGICHSDLSVIDGGFPAPMPVVLGHEASGVVEQIGEGVTSVAPGDPVVLTPLPSCGDCLFCRRGRPTLCERHSSSLITSVMADGTSPLSRGGEVVYRGLATAAFAELAIMPEAGVVRVPDDVDLSVACVIGCAVQTGVGAVLNTARVEVDDRVLVLGAGGIGISVVQGARVAGAAEIVVAEPDPLRRQLALDLGATHVVDPATDDPVAVGVELTGVGFDHAFEAAGRAELIRTAVDAIRPGGTATMVGVPPATDDIVLPVAALFAVTEKRLIGCLLGSVDSRRDIPRLISLWREGRLDLDAMVTSRHPLSDIETALSEARSGAGLRAVVDVAT